VKKGTQQIALHQRTREIGQMLFDGGHGKQAKNWKMSESDAPPRESHKKAMTNERKENSVWRKARECAREKIKECLEKNHVLG